LATDVAIERARRDGVAAVGLTNVDHTGRLGAFVQRGAEAGCLTILFGGGSRRDWRQVVPHGASRAQCCRRIRMPSACRPAITARW
jgi:LDH2 family malate/lactate/ureidoglycolate dehydrogenase